MPGLIVPIAIAMLAGVLSSGLRREAHALVAMACLASAAVCVLALTLRARAIAAGAALVLAFAGGCLLGLHAHDRALRRPIRQALAPTLATAREGELVWVEGRLREDAARSAEAVVIVVDVRHVRVAGDWIPTRGDVRLGLYGTVPDTAVRAWRRGRCVRAPATVREPSGFRNPGGGDASLDLARRGIDLVGSIKSAVLVEACGNGTWIQERAGMIRDRVRDAIARHVGAHHPLSAAIVLAIIVGDRAAIGDEIEERLRQAGTYHVIAISGGNIAILTGLLLWFTAWSRAPPRIAPALALAALAAYATVVVRGASVDRAMLVAFVHLSARMADLRAHPLALLATAAVALLAWDPLLAFDVGFGLTFGATAGLIVFTPAIVTWWEAWAGAAVVAPRTRAALGACVALFAATLAAELAVVPITASAFGRITFAGLALNFLAVPLMAVIQAMGLATVLLAELVPPLARLSGWLAHVAVQALVGSARLAEWWPWLQRVTPPPSPVLLGLHAIAAAVACAPVLGRRARAVAWAGLAVSVIVMAGGWWSSRDAGFPPTVPEAGAGTLRVTMLDVGQGDCVVVQFPRGRTMVIDAGGLAASPRFDVGRRVVSPALHALGITSLDWLVITHGDPDHVGGAAALVADWRPREVWEGVAVRRHAPTLALRGRVELQGGIWRRVRAGDRLWVDEVEVIVWHPPEPEWERQRVRNDDSVVVELRYADVSIVLPGDIGAAVEEQLAADGWPSRLRALKAAHHGSAGSSAAAWLRALAPAAVIYSAGRGNPFGHPAPAAVARAAATGAAPFRTDEDGAVQIVTDGYRMAIRTMSGRRWLRVAR